MAAFKRQKIFNNKISVMRILKRFVYCRGKFIDRINASDAFTACGIDRLYNNRPCEILFIFKRHSLIVISFGVRNIETVLFQKLSEQSLVLKYYGYEAGREWENIIEVTENKKGERKEKIKGWEGKLIPKALVEQMFFAKERREIDNAKAVADETQSRLDELAEEQTGDDGYLKDFLNDKDKVDSKQVAARLKALKKSDTDNEEWRVLNEYKELSETLKKQSAIVKELNAALDAALKEKYPALTDAEVKELLVNRKWYYSIFDGIKALYVTASHSMANRITQLAERYENTLPQLEQEATDYEAKVRAHLERMGFQW